MYYNVCGMIIAYQDASPDAFSGATIPTRNNDIIDSNYVDGITTKKKNRVTNFSSLCIKQKCFNNEIFANYGIYPFQ